MSCSTLSCLLVYSGTSDKGPSEIGTTSLQRTKLLAPKVSCLEVPLYFHTLVYNFTPKIGTTSLQGTKLLAPKVSLVWRFHCIFLRHMLTGRWQCDAFLKR